MSLFDTPRAGGPTGTKGEAASTASLDAVLTAQLVVAWAGESGEQKRLGWWRTDLVSEFGGEDLFKQLLPHTWRWAVLQGAREAARRRDEQLRRADHDPDRLLSLFHLGFELDERLNERLHDLERSGATPDAALPGLTGAIKTSWNQEAFAAWLAAQGKAEAKTSPIGRALAGPPPSDVQLLARQLLAALLPLGDTYPLPHFRRSA